MEKDREGGEKEEDELLASQVIQLRSTQWQRRLFSFGIYPCS